MTETESQQFVDEILTGLWPGWEPADFMYSLWAKELRGFNFNKAKDAIGEWFVETDRTGKIPPINRIVKWLSTQGCHDQSICKAVPVKAFEIFCEDWQPNQIPGGPPVKRRYTFWSPTLAVLTCRDPHEIEQEAEIKRQTYISWFGGSWVVVRTWMQYFDEALL